MSTLTDRSRILAYQSCPRLRYLAYHRNGTGLQRKAKGLPLVFGGAFHEGSEYLLLGQGPDRAVAKAQDFLSKAFGITGVGLDGELPEDAQKNVEYAKEEQSALAEALLRGWWAYEGNSFLQTFEVIEVEQEGRAVLAQDCSGGSNPAADGYQPNELVLMFRPDALVRDRESGDLYVVSWKTCGTFGKRNVEQAKHDMQSMSEVWGVQEANKKIIFARNCPGEPHEDATIYRPKIEGVLYKWIVKGRREKDDWDGIYKQNSHLVYGWTRGSGEEQEWAWRYKWPSEEEGRKFQQLPKGFRKVPVWRDYPGGVKAWISALATQSITPRHINALEAVFPQALPVERRADEVERWKRQVVAQEEDVAEDVEYLSTIQHTSPDVYAEKLDALFPQHTARCEDYNGCSMRDICWNVEVGRDPLGSGLYEIRSANHPEAGGNDD